jgi:hypothetical protein
MIIYNYIIIITSMTNLLKYYACDVAAESAAVLVLITRLEIGV